MDRETHLEVQDATLGDDLVVGAVRQLVDDAQGNLGLVDGVVEALLEQVVVAKLLVLELAEHALKVLTRHVANGGVPVGAQATALFGRRLAQAGIVGLKIGPQL